MRDSKRVKVRRWERREGRKRIDENFEIVGEILRRSIKTVKTSTNIYWRITSVTFLLVN